MTEERFSVSTSGLRELHAGREPWTLLKELVQKRLGRSARGDLLQHSGAQE